MLELNKSHARKIATSFSSNDDELTLVEPFVEICAFLAEFPSDLSGRGTKPSLDHDDGLEQLANRYFTAYRRSDFPAEPNTVPDEMVSVIMSRAYGYTAEECSRIKIEHQYAMCAENCVGSLLERYLDSKLRGNGWYWCCGDFVKAVDFLGRDEEGEWLALQIKNRDNSEISSSSAIRAGTTIQKWYRSYSRDTKSGRPSFTRWDKLPPLMQGYDLSKDGFKAFVNDYIAAEKLKLEGS